MTAITFLGAAETVTGSRYLVETSQARILVDCGLFQGLKRLRERNWRNPPFEPGSLDAVVLTHAHIDHSGYLPRLASLGFDGPVYCTKGTRDLLGILLPDSGYLQEEEAHYANRKGYSKHRPARPLYTREDAEACLSLLSERDFHQVFDVAPGVTARLTRAGHIIGSACVSLSSGSTSVTFTGDVGRPHDPIMKAPEALDSTDYLITESTYGDRLHSREDPRESLARVVQETVDRGGVILVPAFAVGRAQHLLHLIAELKSGDRIPDIPVCLDSPMAIDATDIFCDHVGDHRIPAEACRQMCAVRYARTQEESVELDGPDVAPMIIVSASGMATGGRVLHHLKRFLPEPRNTVLFTGFQAAGTRGRSLVDGASQIKMFGRYIPVRARIQELGGLSAHADYQELLDWLGASALSPRGVFVTHGEPASADALRRRLTERFQWQVRVPTDGERFELAG
jgi:metallo-beta-lactamase family protein